MFQLYKENVNNSKFGKNDFWKGISVEFQSNAFHFSNTCPKRSFSYSFEIYISDDGYTCKVLGKDFYI